MGAKRGWSHGLQGVVGSLQGLPVDQLLPGFLQEFIRFGEMPTAKEPPVHREGRGMCCLKDVMPFLQEARGVRLPSPTTGEPE